MGMVNCKGWGEGWDREVSLYYKIIYINVQDGKAIRN